MLKQGQEFEYNITLKILEYDLSIIDKEIENISNLILQDENSSNFMRTRLNQCFEMKMKKQEDIIRHKKKYKIKTL